MVSHNKLILPDSPILILIIDSFHKRKDGEFEAYDSSAAITASKISEANKRKIQQNRQEIFKLLKKDAIKWRDCEDELSLNKDLKLGKDFLGNDETARYLPALDRFWGDFYEGLGEDGKTQLARSHHHVLILSALYGLLRPFEHIQYYACQFGDKNLAYDIWTKDQEISQILEDYIQKNNIKKVFDFTSCEVVGYHECINWDSIIKSQGIGVLHCYHQFARRDQALKHFGHFVKNQILSESVDKLLSIKPDSIVGDVKVSKNIQLSESETLRGLLEKWETDLVEMKPLVLHTLHYSQQKIMESDNQDVKKYGKNASKVIIARSLASFLNTNGGHLIIGVAEDKENKENKIIGIEDDYLKLQEKERNPDGYRRMIVDMIIKKFIPDIFETFSNYVNISFHSISGKTLCWLRIQPAEKPIFIEMGNEELFYVRIDASSRIVSGKKLATYLLDHFSKERQL